MKKHYLDIDYKDNCFYEYSAEEQEGFTKHTNGSGKVSYRKLYTSGVFGVLQSVSIVESKYQGQKLSLRLLNGEDLYFAGFPMYDQRGDIDNNFTEPLICLLPNMEKNQAYRIFPWMMESDQKKSNGKPYINRGVSVKKANLDDQKVLDTDDAKIEPKLVKCKKDETFDPKKHLPSLEFVEEFGKWKPTALSIDAKRKVLVEVLTKALETLGYNPETKDQDKDQEEDQAPKQEAPKKEAKKAKPVETAPKVEIEDEDYDDLPF